MRPEHHRAWVQQAQLDAERGVIACRMCQRHAGLDETTTLWRNGHLVFALCDLRILRWTGLAPAQGCGECHDGGF